MTKNNKDKISKNLVELISKREERSLKYGDAHKKKGETIISMFGCVPKFNNAEDISRYAMIDFITSKMIRYCANFHKGGHADSLDDISVYAQMLKDLDEGL